MARIRRNPSSESPLGFENTVVALGIGGIALYFLTRNDSPTPSSTPVPTSGSVPRGPLYGTGRPNRWGQAAPTQETVRRILNDPEFRQIYAFQSLAYSTHISSAEPDGIMSQRTAQTMRDVTRRGIGPVDAINRTTTQALSRWAFENSLDVILQPTWLPNDAAASLNRNAIGYIPRITQLLPIQTYDGTV